MESKLTNDEYFAFQLAMSDQIMDLQKNGKTYFKETENGKMSVGDVYLKAYRNVLDMIGRIKQDSDARLICYNGNWYTKDEIDKLLYRDCGCEQR
jgi:hypothetical protein